MRLNFPTHGFGGVPAGAPARWRNPVEARIAARVEPERLRAGAAASRMRGLAARSRGAVREALGHHEEAFRVAPHHPLLARELALALRDAGEFERAIALLRQVVDSGRASVASLVELADLQRTARAWRDAEATIARALMIAPRDVAARLSHAHLLAARGDPGAGAAYGAICIDAPDDARAWRHRGLHALHAAEVRDARRWLARSLEIDPVHSMTWFSLGRACAAAGLSMRAVDCFDRALSLDGTAEIIAGARARVCDASWRGQDQSASICTQRGSMRS